MCKNTCNTAIGANFKTQLAVRFRAVAIVKNNGNCPEPDRTAGQPAVGTTGQTGGWVLKLSLTYPIFWRNYDKLKECNFTRSKNYLQVQLEHFSVPVIKDSQKYVFQKLLKAKIYLPEMTVCVFFS